MNKQKPPVPKALEGGARSGRLRAQAGYKSQVLHLFTVADDPRFVKWKRRRTQFGALAERSVFCWSTRSDAFRP
jgi:hypothetical protein